MRFAKRSGMRVLVVDESPERADTLREGLRRAGYEVSASLSSPGSLLATIEQLKPDVIVIDTESPSRDVLEHLVVVTQHTPRPVVMFSSDGAPETIREAVRAGVSAYVRGAGEGTAYEAPQPGRAGGLRVAAQVRDGPQAQALPGFPATDRRRRSSWCATSFGALQKCAEHEKSP